MNERIKQLMLEAGYAAPEIAGRARKLVELVVLECAQRGSTAMFPNSDPDYVGRKIREHFDVKYEEEQKTEC